MQINTTQLYFILDNTPSSQNIMLAGKHGIGKSRILEDYFAEKSFKVVTLFLGQMSDPGDLIGLPFKNEKTGKTDFMLPYWFPLDDEPVVLFLDELNRARPEVLQTIMDLTLNRKLAGKSLPEGSRIISAVNSGNEYQLTDLDPALVSRFNIYEFAPSVEDWLLWAKKSGIDERITSFIEENPEMLDSFDGSSGEDNLEKTPDRRSWERTSDIIKKSEHLSDLHRVLVSGIIGNKATSLFFKFVSEKNSVSCREILSCDFETIKAKLDNLVISDFTELNSSLFNYFEKVLSKCDCKKELSNFERYFDYLCDSSKSEIAAHLISLCSADDFPETLYLISNRQKSFYNKILNFLK